MCIKILIADDDPLIREGLKIILGMDEAYEIVDCVENGQQAVDACIEKEIDVALLDIRMPVMDGVQAVREICARTSVKPLVLTTFDDDVFIIDAIQYGARGYLLKNNPPDKIKDAIRVVASGSTVMQDIVLDKIKTGLVHNRANQIDESAFSEREMDVMKLVAKGYSNKEIAKELFISEGTVKNYITAILDKTGLEHRTQVAIFYIRGGKI